MRQSIKHKAMTAPEQQIFHTSLAERMSQAPALADVEISSEFTSDQEKMKSIPKKAYR
ncbi:hypothetical protein GCM10008018_34880 [Paenibacillus marchantiophytorum]|uniref:YfhD family protein n=1 Tax=Paenibacillus marchantiophytorum TaxID=1619310 RepID=A0ABQ1EU08_9BACL|nr:hypothetical protein [Paenibacillus marchantiophytorum]GFZ85840.1 hypothetical protein GCM10008018_34880 [Paenibacillus marchantiophytorum]